MRCNRTGIDKIIQISIRERCVCTSTAKRTEGDPTSVTTTIYCATKSTVIVKNLTIKLNNFIIPQDIRLSFVSSTIKILLLVSTEISARLLILKKRYWSPWLIQTTMIPTISSTTTKLCGAPILRSKSMFI